MGDECRKAFEEWWAKEIPGKVSFQEFWSVWKAAWNRRPTPQPDKALVEQIDEILHKEAGLYQHIGSSGILAVSQLLARRLAERFGGWVNVPIVRLGKLKVFQHPGEGILVNSIDVIDECRRQGVLATLDDGKSDAQIYEDHGKTVSLKVTEVR